MNEENPFGNESKRELSKRIRLLKKIRQISKDIGSIQKSEKGYGYNYMSSDRVKNEVMIRADENDVSVSAMPTTISDKSQSPSASQMVMTVGYKVTDNETGESITTSIDLPVEHISKMSIQQAAGATLTYAQRYLLCHIFTISSATEDLDHKDFNKNPRQTTNNNDIVEFDINPKETPETGQSFIDKQQQDTLIIGLSDVTDKTEWSREPLWNAFKKKMNVTSLAEIPQSKWNEALQAIKEFESE